MGKSISSAYADYYETETGPTIDSPVDGRLEPVDLIPECPVLRLPTLYTRLMGVAPLHE